MLVFLSDTATGFSEHFELMSLVQVPCERCERVPSQLHLVFSEGTWARRTH